MTIQKREFHYPALLPALLVLFGSLACDSGSSPTDPSPAESTMIGVVGCSQTSTAWHGWVDIGDSRVWTPLQTYGGGDISEWARTIPNGDYWGRLDTNISGNPQATGVWFEICDLQRDNGSRADADAVVAEIRRRVPGARVFVSSLADFQTPETCGKQDIANSRALTDYLISTGNAEPGPVLPLVLSEWIEQPVGDGGCHVGDPGKQAFGEALAAFPWS